MPRTPVERLDQVLKYWEQQFYLQNVQCRLERALDVPLGERTPLVGSIEHYKDLRQHLLAIRSMEEFDAERYLLPEGRFAAIDVIAESSNAFLRRLGSWVVESRRVFELTEDLQLILLSLSFGKKTCEEIPWPLKTFGINLHTPLPFVGEKNKKSESDFILAAKVPSKAEIDAGKARKDDLHLLVLNKNLEKWHGLSKRNIEELESSVVHKKYHPTLWSQVEKEMNLPGKTEAFCLEDGIELIVEEGRCRIDDVLSVMETDRALYWRIVIGLCFYLQNLPPVSPIKSPWKKTAKKPHTLDLSAVTECSDVCSVSSARTLSPGLRSTLRTECLRGRGNYELPVHFRIAHGRRPWGKGHLPDEPKSVRIPEVMVNRTRLPAGAQPGGNRTRMKT